VGEIQLSGQATVDGAANANNAACDGYGFNVQAMVAVEFCSPDKADASQT
jgi:hypothetical protein